MSEEAMRAAASVSEKRLRRMLMDLAEFGARNEGGVERHALSLEDVAARAYLIDKAEALLVPTCTDVGHDPGGISKVYSRNDQSHGRRGGIGLPSPRIAGDPR